MKVVRFDIPGPPDVLRYVDAPTPEPGPGEVLVKAHSIGVGIPDTSIRKGTYGWMPPLPCIPGTEMSGTVEKVGPGVTARKPGQRVIVTARERKQRGGCYAEYIATEAEGTFVVPDGADMEGAAALANYQVAYHLLKDGARAQKGQTVLVHAAAGGMGNALIDLCRAWGMSVIGVVGSDDKAAFAREMGAAHAINRKTENVAERVKALTGGRGVDLIVDPVGGDTIVPNLGLLAPLGMLVLYGGLGGRPQGDLLAAMGQLQGKCPAFRRFSIHYLDHLPEPRRAGMRDLVDMLAQGAIRPRIHARLPLAEARRAHEMIEGGDTKGKILLKPAIG